MPEEAPMTFKTAIESIGAKNGTMTDNVLTPEQARLLAEACARADEQAARFGFPPLFAGSAVEDIGKEKLERAG